LLGRQGHQRHRLLGGLAFRLTPSGKPDESFGAPAGSGAEGPGFVTFSGGDLSPSPGSWGCEDDEVAHVRANADGPIDVLGSTRSSELSVNEPLGAFWARLKPDGLLDVLWRKVSYGARSMQGSQFVERLLPIYVTLRRQKRSVIGFFRETCGAHRACRASPSGLPS
jgi:hypothetical protein